MGIFSVMPGPNKSRAAGQSCGQILADFVQKRAENGPHFLKMSFSPLILSNFVQIKEILHFSQARRHK
jgi:hypothetical protein